jgi:hypothetical protein
VLAVLVQLLALRTQLFNLGHLCLFQFDQGQLGIDGLHFTGATISIYGVY